jgi:hypothetical protein
MPRDVPDPLKPARIPGQNPSTPERMPGHTGYYDDEKDQQDQPRSKPLEKKPDEEK